MGTVTTLPRGRPFMLVARRSDLTERDLPVAPVLAVEVLSPSTRRIDLTLSVHEPFAVDVVPAQLIAG